MREIRTSGAMGGGQRGTTPRPAYPTGARARWFSDTGQYARGADAVGEEHQREAT